MVEQYSHGVEAITKTASSVDAISAESQRIPEAMSALQSVLAVSQHQIQELERHLDAFGGIRDRAVEAIPEIQNQIEATVRGASEASSKITTAMRTAADSLQEHATGFVENLEVLR